MWGGGMNQQAPAQPADPAEDSAANDTDNAAAAAMPMATASNVAQAAEIIPMANMPQAADTEADPTEEAAQSMRDASQGGRRRGRGNHERTEGR